MASQGSHKQVALVTGASSGIGRAAAELLTAQGFTVFGTSRTPIQDTRSYTWLPLDVRSDDSVQAAVQSLLTQAGRIDLLVNNAGYVQFGAIEESSIADAQAQLDTNLLGVIRMVKAVLPVMRKLGNGRIINISSIVGHVAPPYGGLYATSKFAACGAERGPERRNPPVRSERLARRAKLCEHTDRQSAANQPDCRLHECAPGGAAKPHDECQEGHGAWRGGPRHPARHHHPATSALPSWAGWKNSASAQATAPRVSV